MSQNDTWQSRFIVPRALVTPARRVFNFLVMRLPPPAQKMAVSALHTAAGRWPLLMRLLGITPPAKGPAPRVVADDTAPETNLAHLREASDFAERARAAQALASVRDRAATDALVAALRDRSSEVAAQAAEALGQHRGDIAAMALREVLENRDGYYSPVTRASAVRSLGALLPADQVSAIASAVADIDATVSLAAIAALAERDESTSANTLIGVIENRAGFYLPLTRQAAARALQRLQHCDGDRVRGLLEAESDNTVRQELMLIAAR
jgi:HEAT repeat protein